jgi:CheY-like chemotaxis protein
MKPLILAVDDSKAMRYLLQTVLGKKYQVVTAPDASSAMYWLSQKNFPDVILANAQLRDTGDWEFVDYLRSSFLYKDIPAVILSSLGKAEVEERCTQYKVEQFFLKPFNPVSLLETVDKLVRPNVKDLGN